MSHKYNFNVLVEAKQEYTKQLINILCPEIYVGLESIYQASYNFCEKNNDKNYLKKFQQLLSLIPKWNVDKIEDEYKRIEKATDCDFIEDLITAVFVSHAKVLTSVKRPKVKQFDLDIPNGPYFVHKCYIQCARNFWKKPYLFYHSFQTIDLQRNLAETEHIIKDSINDAIRSLLPVRQILKEYLGNDYNDGVDDDITSQISRNTKDNLRKLVKYEIEQTISKPSIDGGNREDELEVKSTKTNKYMNPVSETESHRIRMKMDNTEGDEDDDKTMKEEINRVVEEETISNILDTKVNKILEEKKEEIVNDDKVEKKIIHIEGAIPVNVQTDIVINKMEDNNENKTSDDTKSVSAQSLKDLEKSNDELDKLDTPIESTNKIIAIENEMKQLSEEKEEGKEKEKEEEEFSFFADAAPF